MAITCPVDLDTLKLRAEIQSIYARVAEDPSGEFHFHRGPEYAARRLNYDAAELSRLPGTVTESFAGVGNPHETPDKTSISGPVESPVLCWKQSLSRRSRKRALLMCELRSGSTASRPRRRRRPHGVMVSSA
jgi:hypothetical protein